jgi:hypothetical protein
MKMELSKDTMEKFKKYEYFNKGVYDAHNSPEAFLRMPEERQEELVQLIQTYLRPIKTINENTSSYGLKHLFEEMMGGYVGNGELKGAMIVCGFNVKARRSEINHHYNISSKDVKHLRDVVDKKIKRTGKGMVKE